MPVLGITGGVAAGKSTFTKKLVELLRAESFDSDLTARELLAVDLSVRSLVASQFGTQVFAENGFVDRAKLRDIVFDDSGQREKLEQILHPIIRKRWTGLAEHYRSQKRWLIVDIPLLFETGAESFFDKIAVVACQPRTQIERMVNVRGLSKDLAEQIVASQLDVGSKVTRANYVIWSDSPLKRLDEQAGVLAQYLQDCYG